MHSLRDILGAGDTLPFPSRSTPLQSRPLTCPAQTGPPDDQLQLQLFLWAPQTHACAVYGVARISENVICNLCGSSPRTQQLPPPRILSEHGPLCQLLWTPASFRQTECLPTKACAFSSTTKAFPAFPGNTLLSAHSCLLPVPWIFLNPAQIFSWAPAGGLVLAALLP